MGGLFHPRAFAGFGPDRLALISGATPLARIHGRPSHLRDGLRQSCPRLPGVYGMVNRRGELIYVGKAKSLRSRLLCYFRPASRDPKAGRVLEQTRAIVWEVAANEFAALLRELELIRRWQPRLNVVGQPQRRRRTFVCLGRRPAPYAFLARKPPSGALAVFGPVFSGGQAREAVRRLNDWYGLRDCSQKQTMAFADQGDLFPEPRSAGCLRYELGTCIGPCAAACSRDEYLQRVHAARAFLKGNDSVPLDSLTRDMQAAAIASQYERAAAIRDKLTPLQWLHERLRHLDQARDKHTFVYPLMGADGAETWYLIRRGWVATAIAAPRDGESAQTANAALEATFGPAHPWVGATPSAEIDGVLLVSAWFRRHAAERDRTLSPSAARERCAALAWSGAAIS